MAMSAYLDPASGSMILLVPFLIVIGIVGVVVAMVRRGSRSRRMSAQAWSQQLLESVVDGGWLTTDLDPETALGAVRASPGALPGKQQGSQTGIGLSDGSVMAIEVQPGPPTRLGFGVEEASTFRATGRLHEGRRAALAGVAESIAASGGSLGPAQ